MYTLEFYDKIMDIERQYHFSHTISPQQALDIFRKMGFDVYPYGAEQNPLIKFADKNRKSESFSLMLSNYNYLSFDKTEILDYLLEDL